MRDGEAIRGWMTERFRQLLRERSVPWIEVRGTHAERMAQAAASVDGVLRWEFAEPLRPPLP